MSVSHIRLRRKVPRGSYIPIYRDKNTPRPFHDDLSGYDCQTREIERGKLDHIYLEDIGAACSCLQVTFQAANLNEARFLYDQLIPFAPIVLGSFNHEKHVYKRCFNIKSVFLISRLFIIF